MRHEKRAQSACGIIEPKRHEKWIAGSRLGELAGTQSRRCLGVKEISCVTCGIALLDRGNQQSITMISGMGRKCHSHLPVLVLIHLGKACSLHTSTTNTRGSIEHEWFGSPEKEKLPQRCRSSWDCRCHSPNQWNSPPCYKWAYLNRGCLEVHNLFITSIRLAFSWYRNLTHNPWGYSSQATS